jgi:glycerophosphoryl diester phosphodiesterase
VTNILKTFKNLIGFNFKKLIVFEILMRLFGIFIIFPLFRLGLFIAIRLSGYPYITNAILFDFLFKPTTIIVILIFLIIFSIYLAIEYVFLSILFDYSHQRKTITYKDFLFLGFKKSLKLIKKYHVFILLPILAFVLLIEIGQIAFFSSSLKLPDELINNIEPFFHFEIYFILIFIILIIIFLEFIFFVHEFIFTDKTIKDAFKAKTSLIKKKRFGVLYRFIIVNVFLNIVMFLLYFLAIFIMSFIVGKLRGVEVVLSIVITSAYTLYWMIGVFFSIIILPINVGLISSIYYNLKDITPDIVLVEETKATKFQKNRWLIRLGIATFIIFFSLNIVSISRSVKTITNQTQFLKQEEIIAHRGASYYAPENTIAAIQTAINQGVDGVEFDVWGTKDDIPVLLHDATLTRTTNTISNKKIWDLTYDEIKDLDAGSWFSSDFVGERIPTFEEAILTLKGKAVAFIDMKTGSRAVESEVYRIILENNMVNDVRIMSFSVNQLYRFKEFNPNLTTILLVGSSTYDIYDHLEDDRVDHFAIEINIINNNPKMVSTIHRYQKKAYAWVVDDQRAIYIGMNADVDGFITKRPIIAREIAYSKNTSDSFKGFLELLFHR